MEPSDGDSHWSSTSVVAKYQRKIKKKQWLARFLTDETDGGDSVRRQRTAGAGDDHRRAAQRVLECGMSAVHAVASFSGSVEQGRHGLHVLVLDTLGPVRVHGVLTGAMEFRRTTAKTKGEGGVSDGGSPREVGGEMRRRGEVGSGSSMSGKEFLVRGVVVDGGDGAVLGDILVLAPGRRRRRRSCCCSWREGDGGGGEV